MKTFLASLPFVNFGDYRGDPKHLELAEQKLRDEYAKKYEFKAPAKPIKALSKNGEFAYGRLLHLMKKPEYDLRFRDFDEIKGLVQMAIYSAKHKDCVFAIGDAGDSKDMYVLARAKHYGSRFNGLLDIEGGDKYGGYENPERFYEGSDGYVGNKEGGDALSDETFGDKLEHRKNLLKLVNAYIDRGLYTKEQFRKDCVNGKRIIFKKTKPAFNGIKDRSYGSLVVVDNQTFSAAKYSSVANNRGSGGYSILMENYDYVQPINDGGTKGDISQKELDTYLTNKKDGKVNICTNAYWKIMRTMRDKKIIDGHDSVKTVMDSKCGDIKKRILENSFIARI